ncbi:type IX secretion system membrane protein PorP/SprF [Allomuricauda taeanensis]|uniref:PorP/SprF family type IX secretion system membrane protein n=1 Tax=Flagellimonas taeanensis TaxID=1005926 RepID=UPI002E7B6F00|nr:type IX secretion system membrane protein PorP/SprF [Allomuricauda taeanensis]MEE1964594.1 type IX secretion system membrane protein PorP/SprF [Allomuricauda taeanensis]
MNNLIIKHLIHLIMLGSVFCHAQQDSQFTHYMYNTMSVNPAYAGSRDALSIVGLHRSQWVGLEGAPKTQTLSLHSPIGSLERVGLGLSFINDVIGPTSETYFNIDFSYNIPVSRRGNLRFGLKVAGQLMDVNYEQLSFYDLNDPSFRYNIDNKFSPNIGTGLYYYTERFYLGLSVPFLLETIYFNDGEDSSSIVNKERIHSYLISGFVFDLNNDIAFKPALLTKMVLGSPLQVDVSANFLFYQKFVIGAAYRWSAAVSTLAGFQLTNSIFLGVAYDKEITALGNRSYNDGSFEFILRYEYIKKKVRRWTPRFF